jgi:hypothetical protein
MTGTDRLTVESMYMLRSSDNAICQTHSNYALYQGIIYVISQSITNRPMTGLTSMVYLATISTDKPSIDPFIYIIALEEHYDIKILLNIDVLNLKIS